MNKKVSQLLKVVKNILETLKPFFELILLVCRFFEDI